MRRFISIAIILSLSVAYSFAQQVLFSNLKNLLDIQGDTVTTLHVERRSKNQI